MPWLNSCKKMPWLNQDTSSKRNDKREGRVVKVLTATSEWRSSVCPCTSETWGTKDAWCLLNMVLNLEQRYYISDTFRLAMNLIVLVDIVETTHAPS
jgi:hypothetical protein